QFSPGPVGSGSQAYSRRTREGNRPVPARAVLWRHWNDGVLPAFQRRVLAWPSRLRRSPRRHRNQSDFSLSSLGGEGRLALRSAFDEGGGEEATCISRSTI